jgi:BolA protein
MGRDIDTVWVAGMAKTSARTGDAAIALRRLTTRPALVTVSAMSTVDRMRTKLTAALAPVRLDIVDESHRHAGHAGSRPDGETHFRVTIVSATFAGQNRLARQRRVHDILAEELAGGVHALSVSALAPDEKG